MLSRTEKQWEKKTDYRITGRSLYLQNHKLIQINKIIGTRLRIVSAESPSVRSKKAVNRRGKGEEEAGEGPRGKESRGAGERARPKEKKNKGKGGRGKDQQQKRVN